MSAALKLLDVTYGPVAVVCGADDLHKLGQAVTALLGMQLHHKLHSDLDTLAVVVELGLEVGVVCWWCEVVCVECDVHQAHQVFKGA